jgi:hypothetical protein
MTINMNLRVLQESQIYKRSGGCKIIVPSGESEDDLH